MTLRTWHLTPAHPFLSTLTPDPRWAQRDPHEHQPWELVFGDGENAAVALQTTFRGRAGMVSLVPMWTLDGRPRYLTPDYAEAPFVRHIAPGYIAVEAALTPTLRCVYEFCATHSHTIAGRISVQNTGGAAVELHIDLIAFVGLRSTLGGREGKVAPAALSDDTLVLSLGTIGDLQPAVALDHPTPFTPDSRGKLGADMALPPGADAAVRFGCAGLPTLQESGSAADAAAKLNWDVLTAQIERLAADIPDLETGSIDIDAAIAASYQTAICALDPALKPENAPDLYLLAAALAAADPERARALVRAALAAQANATPDKLWMPILARLVARLDDDLDDPDFVREALPTLAAFLTRWGSREFDRDGDGLPEWQSENQNAFPYAPTFALSDPNGQHGDMRMAEAPDLAAYLLSEAVEYRSFMRMAGEDSDSPTDTIVSAAQARLLALWRDEFGRYTYRDRDTHTTTPGVHVLNDGRAGDEHFIALDLQTPARLILEVSGGTARKPTFNILIDGIDAAGEPQWERISSADFDWRYSRGTTTTQLIFSRVNRLGAEGLTGMYRLSARTPDWTRLDISALMPLATVSAAEQPQLLALLKDERRFWRPFGVPMVSADDPDYKPAENAAVRPFWLTLILEGLIAFTDAVTAADLFRRLLNAQIETLKSERTFAAAYNPETGEPIGERGSASGIVPLHILRGLLDMRVLSARRVWVGVEFALNAPITLRHRGVTIVRAADSASVTFPSGAVVHIPTEADWGIIEEPPPAAEPPDTPTPSAADNSGTPDELLDLDSV
jgi:hypothetical protein